MEVEGILFCLPVEVLHKHILPQLAWNDCLRLRRVSKAGKYHSDNYIRDHGGIPSSVQVELDTSLHSVSQFLQLDFQATNFFLNNARVGHEFFEDPHFKDFAKFYGDQIVKLQVHNISFNFMEACKGERFFYESLRNLENLEIRYVGVAPVKTTNQTGQPPFMDPIHSPPASLRNVKHLKLSAKLWSKNVRNIDIDSFNMKFSENLPRIETIFPALTLTDYIVRSQFNLLPVQFTNMTRQLRNREIGSTLKYIDFKNHLNIGSKVMSRLASSTFMSLCHELSQRKIKVRNAPAKLFKTFTPELHDNETVSDVAESLIGLHPAVLSMDLPHLKSLQITTWLQRSVLAKDHPGLRQFNLSWPQLSSLNLHVNTFNLSMCIRDGQIFHEMPVTQLFQMLFGGGSPRQKLEKFAISYSSRMWDTLLSDSATFPCPTATEIISGFPNLKVLQVTNWPGGNKLEFAKLWTELLLLEDVSLERCKSLTDNNFIGDSSPVFLQLKRLKKLSLLDLDKMPGITDKTFQLVISRMRLTSLVISSDAPLETISPNGIRSLMTGVFAETIEHFPFHGWSLSDMNRRQFIRLSNLFRSSDMM